MAEDPKKKKRNVFQKIAQFFSDVVEWVEETFSDPEIAKQVGEDLGLDVGNPATPKPADPGVKQRIDAFLAKEDVDEIALTHAVADIKALADTLLTFKAAIDADGVDPWDLVWLVFKVYVADSLRVRNPSAYALAVLAGLVAEDDETLAQLDPAPAQRYLKGEANQDDAEDLVNRLSAVAGGIIVAVDQKVSHEEDGRVVNPIDALYGWDPEPGTDVNAAVVASRALTVVFPNRGEGVTPIVTVIGVPTVHGGPGLLVSVGARLRIEHETESATYTFDLGATGAFSVFVRLSTENPEIRALGPGTPSVNVAMTPRSTGEDATKPFLVFGTSDRTRLEIGSFSYGVELGADHAGFKTYLRKGKLVIVLGDGDGFLANLPGGRVEVPFELGLIADTKDGIRFDGGTGLKIDLPVAASLFGVFTVQFLALELKLAAEPAVEIRGGFSLRLGPFQASIDQVGTVIDLAALTRGADDVSELVRFAPPKGIGLALEIGPIKGGGYLFVDADKGEYAGALELKFLTFSIKAIALITTKRPDGSEGWSLLLFIFAQFKVHIAFGIFWTGLGGMIGLHHRAALDKLTEGMQRGALDDVLFPDNPVADAPRIINRYKELFPVEPESLLVGPMLELSFSEPAIVYVRLGFIFEVRNALGGAKPAELTKVIILGQLLVQLPPKALGAPAIYKILVDIVGFYDTAEHFLLIRSRLRDSFVGIEGFAKLDLTGEMVLAMRFGDEPSFVLTAGGFHPAFKDVPRGVPSDLQRMAVSFGIGPLKIRNENYFAITSNSVQAGCKIEVKADFSIAKIQGHLSFDAILYLEPKFHFHVQLEFQVKLEAFGEDIASVTVRMSLEGPGEWRAKGYFSFSILWWDEEVDFDERWGKAPEVTASVTSAAKILRDELSDPARLLPTPPVGGNALVTLAAIEPGKVVAHPLGLVSLTQKAVPLDVAIDRIGTRRLTEGRPTFSVTEVTVGGEPTTARQPLTEHFARGQFMDLTEQQKLEGRSFETFTSGVQVGSSAYAVPNAGVTVAADYEVEILEPEPRLNLHWVVAERFTERLRADVGLSLAAYGAAATSARAKSAALEGVAGKAVLSQPPLAVVSADTLVEQATVLVGPKTSEAVASQAARAAGGKVVEAFEMARG